MKQTRLIPIFLLAFILGIPAFAGPARSSGDQSVQARLGAFFVEGNSDFWDESEDVFTLEASDFDDVAFGLTYSYAFNRFFELDMNADFFDSTVVSDYRDYVDASGFAILHDSTLETVPLTVGIRFLPFGRARAGAKRPVPFLAAGGGVNFWRYEEAGEFIDFGDLNLPVDFGVFSERGEAFVGYAAAGLELPLSRGFNLGFEARYFKSDDEFSEDFAGLGTLDMSGVAASVSANWRF